jgi:hypothetical protein
VTWCELTAALGVTLPRDLALDCAQAQQELRRGSPYYAIGWDNPGDWPPGAPSMAPWLAERAAHTLTALPRILAHPDLLSPADEAWALAHGLTALRILTALGAQDTFTRLAPFAAAFTARNHPTGRPYPPPCRTPSCRDPDCTLPLLELPHQGARTLPDYLHGAAATLGAQYARRLPTWTTDPLDQLRAELLATFTEEAWTLANGGSFPFEYAWPPPLAVVIALAHFNRWPPPTSTLDQLQGFLDRAAPIAAAAAPHWPKLRDLEDAARGVNLTLVPGAVTH